MTRTAERVLVADGAGFLASRPHELLIAAGDEVVCVDNFFTVRRGNGAHLLDKPNFELMRHGLTFPLCVEVDEIYNLVSPASPTRYLRDHVQTAKTSVHCAINMLGLTKRTRAKILQALSGEPITLYGEAAGRPASSATWTRYWRR